MVTEKQAELIEAINRLTKEKGYPPTIRELAEDRGVAGNSVQGMLERLRKAELVTWVPATARTIRVTEK